MLDLSIVIPTCNRAPHLQRCLESLLAGVRCSHEIIVVDGASTDCTADLLSASAKSLGPRLKIIREPHREGFVRAANKGFGAAAGRCLTWLNDDARPKAGALDLAVARLATAPNDLAFFALFHRWHAPRNVAFES